MKNPYFPTMMEQWVSDTLKKASLIYPSDLCARRICKAFDIEFGQHFGIAGSKIIDHESYIVTDSRLEEPRQHEQFLHELGHILLHAGDQCHMPKMLRESQEWDANLFALYAAIPFHMIDFSKPYTVRSLIDEFTVTESLARKRVNDIRAKTYWATRRRYEAMICEPDHPEYNLSEKSTETQRIMNQLKNQLERKGERLEIHDLL